MAAIPIYDETQNFYVPAFAVELRKSKLPESVLRDVTDVTYTDTVSDPKLPSAGHAPTYLDSFELTINNWDPEARTFKYEGSSNASQRYDGLFAPGMELDLKMGYGGDLRLMLRGRITAVEPDFTESGGATLSVRGQNALSRFQTREFTWSWVGMKDSEIAVELGRNPAAGTDLPGLGMRVVIDPDALAKETAEAVVMSNTDPISFLMERARRRGYVLFLRDDAKGEFLYFGPSHDIHEVTYKLEWGRSLSSFRPTLSVSKQVETVRVQHWNRKKQRAFSGTARFPKDCSLNEDLVAANAALRGGETVIADWPLRSNAEAESIAVDQLRRYRRQLMRGSGATIGLPDLRAGVRVVIANLGPRYGGSYFVTSTRHTIGANGYRTTFDACREGKA